MKRLVFATILVLTACAALASPPQKKVAIVIYDGVEVLDFGGPAEVLEIGGLYGRAGDQRNAFELYTVAPETAAVTSQNFLRVVPDYTPETAPQPDILIIPGGKTSAVTGDAEFMKWIAGAMDHAITLTVCSGASVPAQLGKLDGLTVTTWHGIIDRYNERYPNVSFVHGKRFVDNESIITTAGVSAGIDGALHLVARLLGLEAADSTARYMEYRWTPEPYLVDGYPILNPQLEDAARASHLGKILLRSGDLAGAARIYRAALEDDPDDGSLWYGLFEVLTARKDWRGALDATLKVAESNAIRGFYNAASTAMKLGDHDGALAYLSKAIDSGFHNRSWIERDEDFAALRSDPRFVTLLRRAEG